MTTTWHRAALVTSTRGLPLIPKTNAVLLLQFDIAIYVEKQNLSLLAFDLHLRKSVYSLNFSSVKAF